MRRKKKGSCETNVLEKGTLRGKETYFLTSELATLEAWDHYDCLDLVGMPL